MSAVHQIVGDLVDRKLKRGILYTLVVAWVIEIETVKPLTVMISELFPWHCTNPLVMQVSKAHPTFLQICTV
jgi:hypothetical protein